MGKDGPVDESEVKVDLHPFPNTVPLLVYCKNPCVTINLEDTIPTNENRLHTLNQSSHKQFSCRAPPSTAITADRNCHPARLSAPNAALQFTFPLLPPTTPPPSSTGAPPPRPTMTAGITGGNAEGRKSKRSRRKMRSMRREKRERRAAAG